MLTFLYRRNVASAKAALAEMRGVVNDTRGGMVRVVCMCVYVYVELSDEKHSVKMHIYRERKRVRGSRDTTRVGWCVCGAEVNLFRRKRTKNCLRKCLYTMYVCVCVCVCVYACI